MSLIIINVHTHTHSQEKTNCHSLQLADGYNGSHPHSVYITITKTLKMKRPPLMDSVEAADDNNNNNLTNISNNGYYVQFMTTSLSVVEFQAAIVGGKLDAPYQVSIMHVTLYIGSNLES